MAEKSWEERKAEKIYWQIQHDYGLTSELEVAIARRFYPQLFLENEQLKDEVVELRREIQRLD